MKYAELLNRRVFEARVATLGSMHLETMTSANSHALLLLEKGNGEEAKLMLKPALKGFNSMLGPQHRETKLCLQKLMHLKKAQGR